MATCIKCHKTIESGWTYCPHCGANLKPKAKGAKVRANGTGTAYRRGKTWTGRIVVGYRTKKMRDGTVKSFPIARTKGGFRTKTEALTFCTDLKEQPKQNRVNKNETFSMLYARWDIDHASRIKKSTMDCYRAAYRYFKPIEHEKLTDLTYSELQACIDNCPNKRRTKEDMRTVCSHIYQYAIKNGYEIKNLARELYCGNEKRGTREAFTTAELKQIGEAVGKLPYADYVYCMCYLGFRPNEMLQLTKSSYDAKRGCLIGGFKTKAGTDRPVPISPKIKPIIEKLLDSDSDYIFPKEDGSMMKDDFFRVHCFAPLMQELGIKNRVPYSCRHTFSNLLKAVLGSATDKAALMGHSDISMTLYYQSADYESLKAITEAI